MQPETLILAVGNTLLTDEGIGAQVIHWLDDRLSQRPDVRLIDGGTLSFTLAAEIESCRNLIVLDAAELKSEPGHIRCFCQDEMDHYLGAVKKSVHEVGIRDLMDMVRLTECLPINRALVGIQPKSIEWGLTPTDELMSVVPEAGTLVLNLIEQWAALSTGEAVA